MGLPVSSTAILGHFRPDVKRHGPTRIPRRSNTFALSRELHSHSGLDRRLRLLFLPNQDEASESTDGRRGHQWHPRVQGAPHWKSHAVELHENEKRRKGVDSPPDPRDFVHIRTLRPMSFPVYRPERAMSIVLWFVERRGARPQPPWVMIARRVSWGYIDLSGGVDPGSTFRQAVRTARGFHLPAQTIGCRRDWPKYECPCALILRSRQPAPFDTQCDCVSQLLRVLGRRARRLTDDWRRQSLCTHPERCPELVEG